MRRFLSIFVRSLLVALSCLSSRAREEATPITDFATLKAAAEKGDGEAMVYLGDAYLGGYGVNEDLSEALKWYKKGAEKGSSVGMYRVGMMYSRGVGLKINLAEAFQWFSKAAEKNHVPAIFEAAQCLQVGMGTEQDLVRAGKLFRLVLEKDLSRAQADEKEGGPTDPLVWLRLGEMFLNGWGVEKNGEEALKWYRKAADVQNARAQYLIGYMYWTGKGVTLDWGKAEEWSRKAANQGFEDAYLVLGMIEWLGNGAQKNLPRAYMWLSLAAKAFPEEKKYRDTLVKKMAPEQIAEGDKLLKEWLDNDAGRKKVRRANVLRAIDLQEKKGTENPPDSAENPNKALTRMRREAEKGDAEAQFRLGEVYKKGKIVARDYTEAFKWFERAAEQKYDPAQLALAICYCDGTGVNRDRKKGMTLLSQLSENGMGEATKSLAFRYLIGDRGKGKDVKKAEELFEKAFEQGVLNAGGNWLPMMYEGVFGEELVDIEKELYWHRRAAEKGYAPSMVSLGDAYYEGRGVKQDYKMALDWFHKAAALDDGSGYYRIGKAYFEGKGVKQDYSEARKWYLKAFDHKYYYSGYCLGEFYANGWGVEKDMAEAVKWYRKAAEKWYLEAQFKLALCLQNGIGVEQDREEADKWFRKIARRDVRKKNDKKRHRFFNPHVWLRLGIMHMNGWGLDKNLPEAFLWLSLATKELPEAKEDLKILVKGMTKEQIAEGEKRLKDWLDEHAEAWGY